MKAFIGYSIIIAIIVSLYLIVGISSKNHTNNPNKIKTTIDTGYYYTNELDTDGVYGIYQAPMSKFICINRDSLKKSDYQLQVNDSTISVYDGNRFVGTLAFNPNQALDKLIIEDNQ